MVQWIGDSLCTAGIDRGRVRASDALSLGSLELPIDGRDILEVDLEPHGVCLVALEEKQ